MILQNGTAGDVVFYDWADISGVIWDHAAMIIDWKSFSEYGLRDYPSPLPGGSEPADRPQVIEHSTAMFYDQSKLPRWIDHHDHKIIKIAIVHLY